MPLPLRVGVLVVAFAAIFLPAAASAQSGDDEPGAGEPGKPGSSTVIHGDSGSPGPSGAPGQVITPTPERTAEPAGAAGSGGASSTPTPTPRKTAKPASTTTQVEVEQQSRRSPAVPALASFGLLAGAALLIWAWRRGPVA